MKKDTKPTRSQTSKVGTSQHNLSGSQASKSHVVNHSAHKPTQTEKVSSDKSHHEKSDYSPNKNWDKMIADSADGVKKSHKDWDKMVDNSADEIKKSHKSWDKMLGNSADDLKKRMDGLMDDSTASLRGSAENSNHTANMAKDIMTKLSNNIRHSFEQNMELGQDLLKCKTSTDFIEFQRKNFEMNYKNTAKLYNDLFYDVQNLVNQSLKDCGKYPGKK